MRLPIHCCCNPGERLGWIDAPPREGTVTYSVLKQAQPAGFDKTRTTEPTIEKVALEVARLYEADGTGEWKLAVKSMHLPIETLRRLPTFEEEKN